MTEGRGAKGMAYEKKEDGKEGKEEERKKRVKSGRIG
jgi:hypothetical protein